MRTIPGKRFDRKELIQDNFRFVTLKHKKSYKLILFILVLSLFILSAIISGLTVSLIIAFPFTTTPEYSVLAHVCLFLTILIFLLIWHSTLIYENISSAFRNAGLGFVLSLLISSFVLALGAEKFILQEQMLFLMTSCLVFIPIFTVFLSLSIILNLIANIAFENLTQSPQRFLNRIAIPCSFLFMTTTFSCLLTPELPKGSDISLEEFLIAKSLLGILFGLLINKGVSIAKDKRYTSALSFAQDWALSLSCFGGCSFYGLDLSGIDFSDSNLSHSDFRGCTWYRAILRGVTGLSSSQIYNSELQIHLPKVQKLLTDLDPGDKNFQGIHLYGAYLQNAKLQGVNFIGADLRGADLRGADLRDSLLMEARLDNADLSDAILTGAYIKESVLKSAISNNISLSNVTCDHLYFDFVRGEKCDRRNFAPGEFERLYCKPLALPSPVPQTRHLRKILFLAANPQNTTSLALQQEYRDIQDALARSYNEAQFDLDIRPAARRDDLRRSLLNLNPQIVHFAGHGEGDEGLMFENDRGQAELFTTSALSNLFREFSNFLDCVILNSCYSEIQADAIGQYIDYVIGMKQALPDTAARAFSRGFYDALFANQLIETAFRIGVNAIETEVYDKPGQNRKAIALSNSVNNYLPTYSPDSIPVLLKRPGIHTDPLDYLGPVWTHITPEPQNIGKLHHITICWGNKYWENNLPVPVQGILLRYSKQDRTPYHRSVRIYSPDLQAYPNAITSISDQTKIVSGHLPPPDADNAHDITLTLRRELYP